jgi:hypothetical protein
MPLCRSAMSKIASAAMECLDFAWGRGRRQGSHPVLLVWLGLRPLGNVEKFTASDPSQSNWTAIGARGEGI